MDILNRHYPSIKSTSKYSRERINFLDVKIIEKGNRLLTDVFVKSNDTHQCLHHSKKSIQYSQALRFNRICSKNQFFDKRCNVLEVCLRNRGYKEKLVRQQILYSQREEIQKSKLVFNITYSIFSKLKNVLSKIHLLLHWVGNIGKFLNFAIYGCSSSRTTPGVTIFRSNTGGKTLLQLLFKIG